MTRRLRIQWAPGHKVTGRLAVPPDPEGVGLLLAHGAGAGQGHEFMVDVRERLVAHGFVTLTFDYPYMEEGRRAPDRLPKLLACHRAAADRLARYVDRIVLAGKSMGGRVGSHLAGDEGYPAAGLVYLGYPLVAMGKREPRDTSHLARIVAPQLFVSGTRDPLGPIDLISSVAAAVPDGTVETIPHADHSFRVPKKSGRTIDEVRHSVVESVVSWLASL